MAAPAPMENRMSPLLSPLSSPLPALFVSHGAPTFALEPGRAGPLLRAFAKSLPAPRAVVLVSPHWMTRGVFVGAVARPETIHDFGAFPEPLYGLRYAAPGAPEVAAETIGHLKAAGIDAVPETHRGLDHGAWVPLMHMYPEADIPVLQVSLPAYRDIAAFVRLGRALQALRHAGVLVIGSGSITHNLHDFRPGQAAAAPYASAFADWIARTLADGDLDALLDYRARAPHAERAHPQDDHLMPLLVALGAAGDDWRQSVRIDAGIADGALSMDAHVFGVRAAVAADARQPEAVS
jgi:4,5-DOPA dioxygenase extradiol